MKYLLIFLLLFTGLNAHAKKRPRGLPRTEVGLMNNVLGCLVNKDTVGYYHLFPPFDSLWAYVIHNPDRSPEAVQELNHLKEHPQALLQFDPFYNHSIMARFVNVLTKGEDSGIHWNNVVMQRYELSREVPSRDLIGYDRIAPERFKGYMFVRDLLGRFTFCITITEIQKINGFFFGGQVINILEASTVDQFLQKEEDERKYFAWIAKNQSAENARNDSIKNGLIDTTGMSRDTAGMAGKPDILTINRPDEDALKTRREVIDRKYYEGKFDDEIPVKLFVRYMKDLRSNKVSAYDGLYKFGDQVNYVRLNITRTAEGKWLMEDDPPVGSLELMLEGKTYTGSWNNNENQTGYDVELKQTDLPQVKMEQLENILNKKLSGRADEDIDDRKIKRKGDEADKDKDKDKEDSKGKKNDKDDKKKDKKKDKDDADDTPKIKKQDMTKDQLKMERKARRLENKRRREENYD